MKPLCLKSTTTSIILWFDWIIALMMDLMLIVADAWLHKL